MKPIKLVLISVAVLLLSLVFILSCDTTKAEDPTEEDIQKLGAAMAVAIGDLTFGVDEPGVTFTSESEEEGSVIFSGYTNNGITINGMLTMRISGSGDTASFAISGTLNFTGPSAPVESLAFNFTISINASDPQNPVITVSGTFSIDGTVFNASGIEDMFMAFFPFS